LRHLSHLVAGIGRARVTDQVHQRNVLVAVCVEVALRQVNVVVRGELLHRIGLARPPQDGLEHLPGEHTVDVDVELVAQRVGDAEKSGHGLDLDGQCRRTQHHGVAAFHVCVDQIAHLRIDALLDLFGEQSLADLLEIRKRPAA
jgi:hypothetical protein